MGDPRRLRSKYEGPRHPWERERIEIERVIVKEYGLKNKKEIWKAQSKLRHFANQAKKLVNLTTAQSEKEKKQLLEKVYNLGLLSRGSEMGSILSLSIRDVLNRRLQTVVFRKGLARTINQARQMITHGHIVVDKRRVSVPSYFVLVDEEQTVSFITKSPFTDEMHPERTSEKAAPKSKKNKEGKEESSGKKEDSKEAGKEEKKGEHNKETKEEAPEEKKEEA